MASSASAYARAAWSAVNRLSQVEFRDTSHDPSASPPMKSETTMEREAAVTPNWAMDKRTQIVS